MFADAALAARIDGAEARLCADIAHSVQARDAGARTLVIPVSGGAAVYVSPASPINKVIGMAITSTLDLAALEQIESEWDRRGEPVRVELCVLADPSIAGVLSDRGYRVHGFENVLALDLAETTDEPAPAGVAVDMVHGPDDLEAWIDIAVEAFMNLDGTGSVPDDALSREQLRTVLEQFSMPSLRRYLARMGGKAVGEAALRLDGSLAQLAGAGTLPDARGRGVQKALLHRRLADARHAGCTQAVVTTAPGTRSQENVMRRGFELLYARAIFVRQQACGSAAPPSHHDATRRIETT